MAVKSSTKNARKSETEKLAKAFLATLPTENPAFYKVMQKSHVTGGFWFGLPAPFCGKYLPLEGVLGMKLVEQKTGDVSRSLYLSYKKGLSAGWRGFSLKHKLQVGDVLAFEFITPDTFKVYIFKHKHNPVAANIIEPMEKRPDVANTEKLAKMNPSVAIKEESANAYEDDDDAYDDDDDDAYEDDDDDAYDDNDNDDDDDDAYDDDDEDDVAYLETPAEKLPVGIMENATKARLPINMHAVQCANCGRMRFLETCLQFEEIRSVFTKVPFYCIMKPNFTCNDQCDLETYTNVILVVDKPDLPKTPNGFTRKVEVRSDFSGCDVYYEMPTGRKITSFSEMKQFLEAHPEYNESLLNFTFTEPKIMDTVPGNDGMNNKRTKSE